MKTINNFFKQLFNTIGNFFKRLKSPTPLFWKKIRNISAMVTAIATAITAIPQVSAPVWWMNVSWYVLAISAAATIYAQQKEEKKL